MTRDEHLAYCKMCLNRKLNFEKGIICNLTDEIASFRETCANFREDPIQKRQLEETPSVVEQESTTALTNGAQWFLWIFGLSVVNTLIFFFGGNVSFIFGLGITQLFEGIYIGMIGELTPIAVVMSIFISSIFALIWYFARNLSKAAFIVGAMIYGLDALILLAFQDWLSFGVHAYALFMIFRGYQSIDILKKEGKVFL